MGVSLAGLTVGVEERCNAREALGFCPFIRLDGIWYVKYLVMNDMKLFVCASPMTYLILLTALALISLRGEWLP